MAVTSKYTAQIVVLCEEATKDVIERLADEQGVSKADVVRRCIDAHLPTLVKQAASKNTQRERLAG
jgi:hypothetical protein